MKYRIRALGMAVVILLGGHTGIASLANSADRKWAQGDALMREGNLEAAEAFYKQAAEGYERSGDLEDFAWARIRLASVYEALGRADLAYNTFQQTNSVAKKLNDSALLAAIDNGLGSLEILERHGCGSGGADAKAELRSGDGGP